MKKISLLAFTCLVLLCSFNPSPSNTWKLDPVHSNLGFSVVHLGVSEITGTVQLSHANIILPDSTTFAGGTVTLEADMNTIDTDNDARDKHLKTADFFDTPKFPVLTFQSTSFTKVSGDSYQLDGNLTLHGITKPVTLTAVVKSVVNPTNNKPLTGCRVSGKIKRSDFNISQAVPEAILDNVVSITANLEFGRE